MHKLASPKGKREPALDKGRNSCIGAVIPGTTREMFYCRIDNADIRFAMPFGFDYICQHLNNHGFLTPKDVDHGKVVAMFLVDATEKTGKG